MNNLKLLPIKGIISAKVIKALQDGIDVSVEITEPTTETSIDILDYVQILSIFLDNAIKSASQTNFPELSIAFFYTDNQDDLKIIIENSCIEEQMNMMMSIDDDFTVSLMIPYLCN